MVMDRVHAVEEQSKQQEEIIRDLKKAQKDMLQISPKDPSHVLASVLRRFMGSKRVGVVVVYLPIDNRGSVLGALHPSALCIVAS